MHIARILLSRHAHIYVHTHTHTYKLTIPICCHIGPACTWMYVWEPLRIFSFYIPVYIRKYIFYIPVYKKICLLYTCLYKKIYTSVSTWTPYVQTSTHKRVYEWTGDRQYTCVSATYTLYVQIRKHIAYVLNVQIRKHIPLCLHIPPMHRQVHICVCMGELETDNIHVCVLHIPFMYRQVHICVCMSELETESIHVCMCLCVIYIYIYIYIYTCNTYYIYAHT
jgi:hypothetical protein